VNKADIRESPRAMKNLSRGPDVPGSTTLTYHGGLDTIKLTISIPRREEGG
jgi:hypothetical protein